jgi:glucan 1,3-beta-glucosidase
MLQTRREFINHTLAAAAGLAVAGPAAVAQGADTSAPSSSRDSNQSGTSASKWRGVNLGGWLVLERWMVPDVYAGTQAQDEFSLCTQLGSGAKDRLNRHRETFITAEDFRWIKGCGLNAVRLPVGYWALEGPKPFVECARFVDFAFEQASANGLKLLLDLHGAPGSQNGWDHSGRSGPINWPKDPKNIEETLRILESFAQKYGRHPALAGIELLNEPRDVVPLEILKKFYQDAYARLRPHLNPPAAIVFHDSFRAMAWRNFMQEPEFKNVILDTHLYQCFSDADKRRTSSEQIEFAVRRKDTLDQMQREELPTIVGEWSLALPPASMRGLSSPQQSEITRAYAGAQLRNYGSTRGWFFWSYKLQQQSDWNFRRCVERGYLPAKFTA